MICQREGCENVLTGKQRRWCSDNCRKWGAAEAARAPCPECGRAMARGSKWASKGFERCMACHLEREARAWRARLEDVAVMYNEGMSQPEIAVQLGYGPTSVPPEITEARRAGLITTYRYSEARRTAAIEGRRK